MRVTVSSFVRTGDRAKLRQGDSGQLQRGLLHDSKSLAATQARLVRDHQCVRWRAQGVADNLDRLDLQGRGRPSRSNPQRRARRPRDSREHLSPGPTDTAMFGRFPGEEQGEAVKDVLRTN